MATSNCRQNGGGVVEVKNVASSGAMLSLVEATLEEKWNGVAGNGLDATMEVAYGSCASGEEVKGMAHILGEGERGHACLMRKKKPHCEEGNIRRECRRMLIWSRAVACLCTLQSILGVLQLPRHSGLQEERFYRLNLRFHQPKFTKMIRIGKRGLELLNYAEKSADATPERPSTCWGWAPFSAVVFAFDSLWGSGCPFWTFFRSFLGFFTLSEPLPCVWSGETPRQWLCKAVEATTIIGDDVPLEQALEIEEDPAPSA
ncbi:hypothetical protein V8G54_028933 [Vigna mungo]|uniref:Uncharacterized protein n=1 Tax=Vigna mungo TaxID=3915 RepID=A0AAQ3MSY6_VIGMU